MCTLCPKDMRYILGMPFRTGVAQSRQDLPWIESELAGACRSKCFGKFIDFVRAHRAILWANNQVQLMTTDRIIC